MTLDRLIPEYEKILEAERQQQAERDRQNQETFDEWHETSHEKRDSGGSFVKDVISTAADIKIGTGGIKKNCGNKAVS